MDVQPTLFPVPERVPGPIERAVVEGDDLEAINAVLAKVSRALDECNSARDIKALAITVIDGVARRRELGGGRGADEGPRPLVKEVMGERRLMFGG
ncbi:MAG: hypothetical protein Q4B91_03460 [Atopobiaceae bacterium]|nr:hypothetical protein [Atopobiaceae bacterium]